MTKTITLTGNPILDYSTLKAELEIVNTQMFNDDLVRLEKILVGLGAIQLQWDVGSEYDDQSSYFDVIESIGVFGKDSVDIDLYRTFQDVGIENPFSPYQEAEIYEEIDQVLSNHLDIITEKEFSSYNILSREVS